MKVLVKKGKLQDIRSQAVILALFQDQKELTGNSLLVDQAGQGLVTELLNNGDFSAKPSQVAVVYTRGAIPAQRIVLVGLGKKDEINLEKIRAAFSKTMQHLRGLNIKEAATSIDLNILPDKKDKVVQAAVEGALLGLYQYTPYKTVGREDIREMEQLNIVTEEENYSSVESAVKNAEIIAAGVCFTRDLISAPSNEMTPSIMAKKAEEIARRKNVSCKVFDKSKMKKLGMNALLGVASGSSEEPKFIILEYSGGKRREAKQLKIAEHRHLNTGRLLV